jgi:hypothetical protein
MLIDATVRELAERFIEVSEIKEVRRFGVFKGFAWKCREFNGVFEAEQYLKSGRTEKLGERTEYFYPGDIFKCYSSYEKFPLFLRNCAKRDFDFCFGKQAGYTSEAVEEFCRTSDYEASDTFYNPSVKDKNRNKESYISEMG